MSHEIKLNKTLREELKCHRCKSLPTLEGLERHRCTGYDNHAICKICFKKNRNCPCGRPVNPYVCSVTRKLFTTRKLPISCKFNSNGCQILHFDKVENTSKDSKDSIALPSVKTQIMDGKVCLRCRGKTLLGVVNKLFLTKTSPINVLP